MDLTFTAEQSAVAELAATILGDTCSPEQLRDAERNGGPRWSRDAWQKLEKAANLERIPGRGWHSLRRKFATELKQIPLVDLCNLGGWKDPNTVLKCYMKPDERTMRQALAGRSVARSVAANG